MNLPNYEKCKSFSEYEAIKYLSDVNELIEGFSDSEVDSDIVNDLIIRLSNSYFDYYNKFIDKICDHYISKNTLKQLNRLLLKLTNESTIDYICTFVVNFSEHSEIISHQLGTTGILNYAIDKYFQMDLSQPDKCKTNRFFKLYVTIIHNYYRFSDNISKYKIDDIKRSFFKMIQLNSDDYFGIISMLILSYIIDEKEVEMLDKGINILSNLLQKIKFTSNSPLRVEGFTLNELIHGLRCIASNDKMKREIDEKEGIPLLIHILKEYKDDKPVIESTLGVLEHLCFIDEIKLKFKNFYKIKNYIKPFSKSKSEKIRKIYDRILWRLDDKYLDLKLKKSENFDVFISYCWANKDTINDIVKSLKIHNIRAWIDKEQMSGSSIDAMAKGIQNSTVFLIGMSSSYKKSPNCRHEAEYAFRIEKPIIPLIMELKYKPTDWLGFIVGNKIYFEFSERRDPNKQVKELIVEIHRNLHPNKESELHEEAINNTNELRSNTQLQDETEVRLKSNSVKNSQKLPVECDRNQLDDKIKMWTNDDVLNWLDKIEMSRFKSLFGNLDGSELLTMRQMYLDDPTFFRENSKNYYSMNFVELVKFENAIKKLLD